MKKQTLLSLLPLVLVCVVLMTSCKKKEEPEPAPIAVTDNVDMGTDDAITINVLANDTYNDNSNVRMDPYTTNKLGEFVVNANSTITFTAQTNYYGIDTVKYILSSSNGTNTTGKIIIKRGTDAQINTVKILSKYSYSNEDDAIPLYLFAIDGDTTNIDFFSWSYYLNGQSNNRHLQIFSDDETLIPTSGNLGSSNYHDYHIVEDGNIVAYADSDDSPFVMIFLGEFTASAKKSDGSGNTTVNGFSIECYGKKLDFTNPY